MECPHCGITFFSFLPTDHCPVCTLHLDTGKPKGLTQAQLSHKIHELAIKCWYHEISADDAHEAIMDLLTD